MPITWMELQAARDAAGLTQAELAAKLGVSTRTIVNWEANGVPRKSEHKVVDLLAEHLETRKRRGGLGSGIGQLIPKTPDYEKMTIADASDEDLLNALLLRARQRRLMFEGANVGGVTHPVDLHDVDVSTLRLAASFDGSAVQDQPHPSYEDESQDPEV